MGFLSIMAYYFGFSVLGDSVLGEHLMNAATDGDVQEAKAILEYNPRLAKYSTSGLDKSPLHCVAKRGHHQIVSLLLESGVKIDHVNSRGQTALMKACQYGHWEVVHSLMLLRVDVHKADYRGGTALHYAAIGGHTRCICLLLADYVPSIPDFWNFTSKRSPEQDSTTEFDEGALSSLLNKTENGGFTALHLAALHGHAETVHLLVSLGASVSEVTAEDGTIQPFKKKDGTMPDPIGRGSTPLHYAAYGGNALHDAVNKMQHLIAKDASLTAENSNGLTPLMVARLRGRHWLEGILNKQQPDCQLEILPPEGKKGKKNKKRWNLWADRPSENEEENLLICIPKYSNKKCLKTKKKSAKKGIYNFPYYIQSIQLQTILKYVEICLKTASCLCNSLTHIA